MCYFPVKIKNKRFVPTKKNGYKPPVCTDERLRYIEVECGHCFECRKKKRNAWRVRNFEQLRETPTAIFFKMCIRDRSIQSLSMPVYSPLVQVNPQSVSYTHLATYGVPIGAMMMDQYLHGKLSPENEIRAEEFSNRVILYGDEERQMCIRDSYIPFHPGRTREDFASEGFWRYPLPPRIGARHATD